MASGLPRRGAARAPQECQARGQGPGRARGLGIAAPGRRCGTARGRWDRGRRPGAGRRRLFAHRRAGAAFLRTAGPAPPFCAPPGRRRLFAHRRAGAAFLRTAGPAPPFCAPPGRRRLFAHRRAGAAFLRTAGPAPPFCAPPGRRRLFAHRRAGAAFLRTAGPAPPFCAPPGRRRLFAHRRAGRASGAFPAARAAALRVAGARSRVPGPPQHAALPAVPPRIGPNAAAVPRGARDNPRSAVRAARRVPASGSRNRPRARAKPAVRRVHGRRQRRQPFARGDPPAVQNSAAFAPPGPHFRRACARCRDAASQPARRRRMPRPAPLRAPRQALRASDAPAGGCPQLPPPPGFPRLHGPAPRAFPHARAFPSSSSGRHLPFPPRPVRPPPPARAAPACLSLSGHAAVVSAPAAAFLPPRSARTRRPWRECASL